MLLGTSDGRVLNESLEEITFAGLNDPDTDDGLTAYELVLESKEFRFPKDDTLIGEIRILYTARRAGLLTLEYSKNGGDSWLSAKTHNFAVTTTKTRFSWKALRRGSRIMWRIRCATGLLIIHEYELYTYSSGESRDGAYPGSRT